MWRALLILLFPSLAFGAVAVNPFPVSKTALGPGIYETQIVAPNAVAKTVTFSLDKSSWPASTSVTVNIAIWISTDKGATYKLLCAAPNARGGSYFTDEAVLTCNKPPTPSLTKGRVTITGGTATTGGDIQ